MTENVNLLSNCVFLHLAPRVFEECIGTAQGSKYRGTITTTRDSMSEMGHPNATCSLTAIYAY